jgi:CopG family nickel-responsive transcriptional regulator
MTAAVPLAPALARLSISLPAALVDRLDRMVVERGLPSRSQLIAELIQHDVAGHEALTRPHALFAGTITLVYRAETSANAGRVRQQLAQVQGRFLKEVISAQHVFLEDDQSLEVLLVQGPALRLRALADALRSVRGVAQLQLVTTTALLPPLHDQRGPQRASHRTPHRTSPP